MPKYILSPDGSVKDTDGNEYKYNPDKSNDKEKFISAISSKHTSKAGSFYDGDETNFFKTADVNLINPFEGVKGKGDTGVLDLESDGFLALGLKENSTIWDHTIGSTPRPTRSTFSDFFPERKDENFLINPSFGADKAQTYYKNFNDQKDVFASEAEMMAGLDFHTAGLKDLTRITFVIDYLFEAISYIAVIEGILAAEEGIIVGDSASDKQYERNMELGNYGSVSYTALTRFIYEVLQYPKDKSSTGTFDRLGAFFVGLSLYLNADPQVLLNKFKWKSGFDVDLIKKGRGTAGGIGGSFLNLFYYLINSTLTFSNIGNNRLLMLIRRFHQKSDWHRNRLFNAKENERALAKDNAFERFIVELNYYYVKFIIERMNVGLRLKNYYSIKGKSRKFNRSGRLKDSPERLKPEYEDHLISNDLYMEDQSSKMQSISNRLLGQSFIIPNTLRQSMLLNDLALSTPTFTRTFFRQPKKDEKRLSRFSVQRLEERYEKEMMPFYFQDLRTNEIIGFHAFIDSITDNFNANYNPTKGFGRIDDVRHYVDTTRNVNVTFTLAAMSKEDHDLMWYQINKIVSMVYPQFSEGFRLKTVVSESDKIKKFVDNPDGLQYPFTQVPTASPLIRIRLGDILKSNYSDHAIQKIHGNPDTFFTNDYDKKPNDPNYIPPIERSSNVDIGISPFDEPEGLNAEGKFMEDIQENGFDQFILPGEYRTDDGTVIIVNHLTTKEQAIKDNIKWDSKDLITYIKNVYPKNTLVAGNFKGNGKLNETLTIDKVFKENFDREGTNNTRKTFDDYTRPYGFSNDPNTSVGEDHVNNPVTAAYQTTFGKGLAGFITMLDVNYNDQLWETEVKGSKAPKLVKITINFAPIHDIPPGLDADGAMRAPVYNAGRIVNTMYGEPYHGKIK